MVSVHDLDGLIVMEQAIKLIECYLGKGCEIILSQVDADGQLRITRIENPSSAHEAGDLLEGITCASFTDQGSEGLERETISLIRTGPNGHVVRSTSVALCGHDGTIVGALTANFNITDIILAQNVLQQLSNYTPQTQPIHCKDVNEMMDLIINEAAVIIKKPVALMNREDKKEFIRYLDERGIFQIKKSSEKAAKFLDISKFTLYACLEEIRMTKDDAEA